MSLYKNLSKTADAFGSVGGMLGDFVSVATDSSGIIKEKVNSSIEEERIEQATNRILLKAKSIKKIVDAIHCTPAEAEELLDKEMQNARNS